MVTSLLQKDFNILADLSLSGPSCVGQKASEPILFVSLFTGAPSFSKRAHPLSNAAFEPCLVLSQVGIFNFDDVADGVDDIVECTGRCFESKAGV